MKITDWIKKKLAFDYGKLDTEIDQLRRQMDEDSIRIKKEHDEMLQRYYEQQQKILELPGYKKMQELLKHQEP